MGKYRVKHASVGGPLTGKAPGDQVSVTGEDEQHLLALGLIETEDEYEARQTAKAEAEAEDETEQVQDDGQVKALTDENTKLKSALERTQAQLSEVKERVKADGKKHADEAKALKADVKAAQAERDAALAKIPKEGADVESGQPADGQ